MNRRSLFHTWKLLLGSVAGVGGERKQVLATITGHCLPKLVCQLHALESREHISDSERNLISLVG